MSRGFKLAPSSQREIDAKITSVDGTKLDLQTGGIGAKSLKTIDDNTHLLQQIVVELRINNKILNEVHDLDVNEQDVLN